MENDLITRILIGIIVFLSVIALVQHHSINLLDQQYAELQSQLIYLETESRKQIERFETEKKNAEKAMQEANAQAEKIMKTKVSSKCEEAIKWGIDAARNFR